MTWSPLSVLAALGVAVCLWVVSSLVIAWLWSRWFRYMRDADVRDGYPPH